MGLSSVMWLSFLSPSGFSSYVDKRTPGTLLRMESLLRAPAWPDLLCVAHRILLTVGLETWLFVPLGAVFSELSPPLKWIFGAMVGGY